MNGSTTTADAMEGAVLPHCPGVRTDGRDHGVPVPAAVTRKQAKSEAKWPFHRFILQVYTFEGGLDKACHGHNFRAVRPACCGVRVSA